MPPKFRSSDELNSLKVDGGTSLLDAVATMDHAHFGIVLIVDSADRLEGVLTDGDFRRAVLGGLALSAPVREAMNQSPIVAQFLGASPEHLSRTFRENGIRHAPIVDDQGRLVDLGLWLDSGDEPQQEGESGSLDCDVLIMAGGLGSRLDPFTRVLPKPLIPVGDKPIIEIIVDRLAKLGARQFIVSLNHKRRIIRSFLEDLASDYSFLFVEEDQPLGTAGALGLLPDELHWPIIVSNCDVLIEANLGDVHADHVKRGSDITIVGAARQHVVPYGVCEVSVEGTLLGIREKPKFDFIINTGVYVVSREAKRLVQTGVRTDMTDLIRTAQQEGLKISVFPVSDRAWVDVGQWAEYQNAVRRLGELGR